jgi:hypothetical protein
MGYFKKVEGIGTVGRSQVGLNRDEGEQKR